MHFDKPVEALMYDESMALHDVPRQMVRAFGPLILKNVYLSPDNREQGHRAISKNLNFHFDRGAHQEEQHSLYYRDPFDPIQAEPRISSTLFIANIVASLQKITEEGINSIDRTGVQGHYLIFGKQKMEEVLNNIIIEHRWDEPTGIGEISLLDNRTALHASYYRTRGEKGYKIGVRYLK
jgi:hypothetical protein